MSYNSRLQTNNTNLQALIEKANTLPDATGGAISNIETCTVTVEGNINNITVVATYVDDTGELHEFVGSPLSSGTLNYNFVKGSTIVFIDDSWVIIPNGVTAVGADHFGYYVQNAVAVFKLTSDTATFTFAE